MKPDQSRLQTILFNTIPVLCRNGLSFSKEIKVQGLLGITIDNSDVILVQFNEVIDDSEQSEEFQVERKFSVSRDEFSRRSAFPHQQIPAKKRQRDQLECKNKRQQTHIKSERDVDSSDFTNWSHENSVGCTNETSSVIKSEADVSASLLEQIDNASSSDRKNSIDAISIKSENDFDEDTWGDQDGQNITSQNSSEYFNSLKIPEFEDSNDDGNYYLESSNFDEEDVTSGNPSLSSNQLSYLPHHSKQFLKTSSSAQSLNLTNMNNFWVR